MSQCHLCCLNSFNNQPFVSVTGNFLSRPAEKLWDIFVNSELFGFTYSSLAWLTQVATISEHYYTSVSISVTCFRILRNTHSLKSLLLMRYTTTDCRAQNFKSKNVFPTSLKYFHKPIFLLNSR